MKALINWFDDRTGFRSVMHETLYERVPGGARWRYVWGSTLVFTFSLQVITGVFLWTAYSPSAQTAWESVYYIQEVMLLGNIVRGIHHFAAQAMVVLMAIHLIQVIIDGAYKAPREVNFWLGLVLMQIVLGLSLTGYLLPWDQKGYYATQVSTEIMGATPVIGPQLQQLVQGGPQYGHHTLTRFFALHAGVLPGLLIAFLVLHIYVFRRHGITVPDPDRAPETTFWPDQVLKDAVACLAVLSVVLLLSIFKGAELSAPANPSEPYSAARPEWYFLFLFRFLKFEAVEHYGLAFGAIYIPGILMGILTLMPLIAWWKHGHRFNLAFLWVVMTGVVVLTGMAFYEDATNPEFQTAVASAKSDADRIHVLAGRPERIPLEGAGSLLQNDPLTQGPRIFKKNCAACHRYDGHDGTGLVVTSVQDGKPVETPASAADLGNFGSRDWMRSVLLDYRTVFAPLKNNAWYTDPPEDAEVIDLETSEMADWSDSHREMLQDPANAADLDALLEFFAAQTQRADLQPIDAQKVARGRTLLEDGTLTNEDSISSCTDCHGLQVVGESEVLSEGYEGYPNLTGYASAAWLTSFISDPGTEQHYGAKNRMPAYAERMSPRELDLLVRWMVGDYYRGKEASAEP